MQIGYDNKTIPNVSHTKFLGITFDNKLSWRNRVEQLVNKLSTACYVIHAIKSFMSHSTLIMIYYTFFTLLGLTVLYFWGTLPIVTQFLRCKLGAIRIIIGCRSRDSYRRLFKKLKILPLKSQYKFTLLLFVVNS
jgi:hypothetical protein